MIQYLQHKDIDKRKWDRCIEASVNPILYCLSWWLDVVSPGWEALVEDDYLAVMPLTQSRKAGISYLYQPFFSQQLGIVSNNTINAAKTAEFLNAIPSRFRYIDIQLNRWNDPFESGFICRLRTTYLLDLSESYDTLQLKYSRSCRRNISKANRHRLTLKAGPGSFVFARFIKRNLDHKLQGTAIQIYQALEKICSMSIEKSKGEILGVFDAADNLVASQWLIKHKHGYALLVCASTEKGRKTQAMYFLIDQLIRQYAGTKTMLDFSGSDIPGIAYFNAGFGAVKSSYPAIKRNTLPWPLRLLKR